MSNLNPNLSQQSASISVTHEQSSKLYVDLNLPQSSKKHLETNQKDIFNYCYPEDSPQNGQFIIQTKNISHKPIEAQSYILSNFAANKPTQIQPDSKSRQTAINKQAQKSKSEQILFQKILNQSKLLKLVFDHFCNISYSSVKQKTFQEMQTKYHFMSLNRFMLFCKEFNIYSIIKYELKGQNTLNQTQLSRANTFHKKSQELMEKSPSQYLTTAGKSKMLEIPVKENLNFEKKMISIFRSCVENNQKMAYDNFVHAIEHIYAIFTRHTSEIYSQKKFTNESQVRDEFLSKILFIKDKNLFRQKMDSLKIEFKGSISYHAEPLKRKSQKYLTKALVMHGGRAKQQMKKELQVYQSTKFKKTQTWIDSQQQMVALYSKSRVFYKPTPAKIYETNDVIRLARREAGRMHTQSLFDINKPKIPVEKKHIFEKKPQTVTFSKVFEDKTNIFGEKLQKIKEQLVKKDLVRNVKKQVDKDDEILRKHFENERRTYGNETFSLMPHY